MRILINLVTFVLKEKEAVTLELKVKACSGYGKAIYWNFPVGQNLKIVQFMVSVTQRLNKSTSFVIFSNEARPALKEDALESILGVKKIFRKKDNHQMT